MLTLSARLQLELRNRDPSEITELILDNSKANEIEGLDETYSNLRELSLVNVGLTTLKGFPTLSNLEKLDLSDNKISSGLENLSKCVNLNQLLLTNNRLKHIKDLENLSNLNQLEVLDLFNCAVSYGENYRKDVFSLIPTLKYLDGFDEKNEEELNESEEYDEEDEEEEEHEIVSGQKDTYDNTDNSESEDENEEEEYESEDAEIVQDRNTVPVASKTGGKDMNLFHNDAIDMSDDDEDEEDEEDDEDLEEDGEGGLRKREVNHVRENNESGDEDDVDDLGLDPVSGMYEDGTEDSNNFASAVSQGGGMIETNGKLKQSYLSDNEENLSDGFSEDDDNNDDEGNEDNATDTLSSMTRKRTFTAAFNSVNQGPGEEEEDVNDNDLGDLEDLNNPQQQQQCASLLSEVAELLEDESVA